MSQILVPGIRLTTNKTVTESDAASIYGPGYQNVFSTPAMIALMQQTAMRAVEACLDEGEVTVGTEINVKHLKAVRVGESVTCTATLKEVNGRRLLFHVVVTDDAGKIGEGHHERFIVEHKKFTEQTRR